MGRPYFLIDSSAYFPVSLYGIAAEPMQMIHLEQVLMLKRYSWRTIKGYKSCFRQFLMFYNGTRPSQLTRRQMDEYIVWLIKEKRISESYQNQILSAIKMF